MFRTLAVITATAGLYLLTGVVERLLSAPIPHRVTGWWPCGVGVAAVWLAGRRAAPGVFLGELVYVAFFTAAPTWGGLITGLGNTAEVLLAVALLRRAGYRAELDRPRDVLTLLLAAAVAPLAMVALQVPMSLATGWPADGDGAARVAACWVVNDAVGILFVVPLLAARHRLRPLLAGGRWEWLEGGLLLAGLAAAGLVFGAVGGAWLPGVTAVAFPFLVWSALRFGPPLTAVALAVYAGVLALLVARGLDPFPADHWSASFPTLHLLLFAVAGTGLLLAAATAARRAAERRLVEAEKWEGLAVTAAGLAHEFNNRLTEVVGFLELAAADVPPGSRAARHLDAVRTAARRMADRTRLVQAAGGHAFGPTGVVDLGAVAAELAAPGVRVAARPGGLTVAGNPDLARLAVGHLLANAVEAAGAAAVAVEVGRAAAPDGRAGEFVRVRVTDAGPGMSAATAGRAFDLYYTTKFPGRGLGLPVARGVATAAGGFVRLDTAPGRGTVVDLYWPAA